MELREFAELEDDVGRAVAWIGLTDAQRYSLLVDALDRIEDFEGFAATVLHYTGNPAGDRLDSVGVGRLREDAKHVIEHLSVFGGLDG